MATNPVFIYDGVMSAATIMTAMGTTVSAAQLLVIPYSNGQKVIIIKDGAA